MTKQLSSILLNILPPEHNWKIVLLQNWPQIIGELKDKVRIEKIEQNMIVLGVCHPAWAQELSLCSNVLKNKINKVLKADRIKTIRFKTVTLKGEGFHKHNRFLKSFDSENARNKISFSKKQLECLDNLKNKDLRDLLVEYFERCYLIK